MRRQIVMLVLLLLCVVAVPDARAAANDTGHISRFLACNAPSSSAANGSLVIFLDTANLWYFADTQDPTLSDLALNRLYALATAAYLAGKQIWLWNVATTTTSLCGVNAFRFNTIDSR